MISDRAVHRDQVLEEPSNARCPHHVTQHGRTMLSDKAGVGVNRRMECGCARRNVVVDAATSARRFTPVASGQVVNPTLTYGRLPFVSNLEE